MIAGIETSMPGFTLLLAALAAAACVVATYRYPWPEIDSQTQPARRTWLPTLTVLAATTAYAVVASIYAINQHHNLGTTVFDLAIYDNIFWQTIHGRPLGTTLIATGYHTAAHFDPLLVLLSPIYFFYQRAELLLGLQSVWLASSTIPLYLLARRELGHPWHAVVLACALLLYPAMHGANFYDFHSLSLVAPLFLWAIYFVETSATRRYGLVLVLMLLTREDIPLLTCFLGLYAIIGHRSIRLGAATIGISLLYFTAVRLFIGFAAGDQAHSYAYYYRDLIPDGSRGIFPFLVDMITKPLFVVRYVFSESKLLFLVTMLLPVLFLPFLARRGKILMVFGLASIILATRGAVYSVHFQYTSILYPAIYALVPIALAGLNENVLVQRWSLDPRRLTRALIVGVLVASVVVSVKFGALVPNDSFRAGYGEFHPYMTEASRATYDWVEQAVALIPRDAGVAASKHMAPHVSNRLAVYRFPWGWGSDYLFIDRHELKQWSSDNIELLLETGAYEIIAERDGKLLLLRRIADAALPVRLPR